MESNVVNRYSALPAAACALASLVLCVPLPARAQPQSLPPVVVTATRTPQPVSTVLADVVTIESETIRDFGPGTLSELLQAHGGVEISATGGAGQPSSMFVRGTSFNHVLVLVDGVRLSSVSSGAAALEHIPLGQIERIEVLRGPASSLYGSDAIGGVVQIFTRSGERTEAEVGAGTWQTRKASFGVGRRFGAAMLSVQGGYRATDAFSATNAAASPFFFNPDDDPYRNGNVGVHLTHDWASGQSLSLRGLHSEGHTHFDAGPTSDNQSRQRLSSLSIESRNRITSSWNSLLRIARGSDHLRYCCGFDARFDTDQDQATWQNDLSLLGGQATAGVEWRQEKLDSDTAFMQTRRRTAAAFGGYSARLKKHFVQASLRHDDSSQYGGRTTGNLAYGYSVGPAWRLSAAAGAAFKAPTFNDLFDPFTGNPDLRPERSRSKELAARYTEGMRNGGVTLFHTRVRDFIALDQNFVPVNVDPVRIRGATLDGGATHGIWQWRAEWTHQEAIDTAARRLLPRRARNHGSASLSATPGPWRLGIEYVGSSMRFDDAANTPARRLGGYSFLNLRAAYAIDAEWTVSLRLNNALDKRYELARGFNTPGRHLFVSLAYAAKPSK